MKPWKFSCVGHCTVVPGERTFRDFFPRNCTFERAEEPVPHHSTSILKQTRSLSAFEQCQCVKTCGSHVFYKWPLFISSVTILALVDSRSAHATTRLLSGGAVAERIRALRDPAVLAVRGVHRPVWLEALLPVDGHFVGGCRGRVFGRGRRGRGRLGPKAKGRRRVGGRARRPWQARRRGEGGGEGSPTPGIARLCAAGAGASRRFPSPPGWPVWGGGCTPACNALAGVPYRPRSPAHGCRRRVWRVAAWWSRVVAASAPACQRPTPTHPPRPGLPPPRDACLPGAAPRVTFAAAAAPVSTAIVPLGCRSHAAAVVAAARPLCHLPCLLVPCIPTCRALTAARTLSLHQPHLPPPPRAPPRPARDSGAGFLWNVYARPSHVAGCRRHFPQPCFSVRRCSRPTWSCC